MPPVCVVANSQFLTCEAHYNKEKLKNETRIKNI